MKPTYYVQLRGKRGKVQTLTVKKKMRIPPYVQERDFAEGTLRVTYDYKLDMWNEAEFMDYKSFLKVWKEFTEATLMKEMKEWHALENK